MKLYERIENNNFDEIDRNRAIELIEGGNEHLVYNENYFKLQKENEELKQERYNNNQMIALAQNEVLGYMQGYEDGKKLKRSAVACVVENQQYYIIKKKIEQYNEKIEKLQKENEELKIKNNAIKRESEAYAEEMIRLDTEKQDYFEKYRYHLQQNESLTKEFSNVILVQKVKDKIRHYQELQDNYIKKYDEINEGLQAMINVLQELLEGRK